MTIGSDIKQIVHSYDKANLMNILNKIQDKNGFLSEEIVKYMARELGIPESKIYETASFYSFLGFEKKGRHTIRVCNSPSCYMNGSVNVIKTVENVTGLKVGEHNNIFNFEITQCIGCCDEAPAMLVDDVAYTRLDEKKIKDILEKVKSSKTKRHGSYKASENNVNAVKIVRKTGFKSLEKARSMNPEEVISKVKKSGLSGRGGAGFSTGIKWEFVNKTGKEGILICNFDEGEPGTFKDKFILLNNAETLVEGIAIASYALKCRHAYIYFRKEYSCFKDILQSAIDSAKGKLKGLKIEIIDGAGSYICGDETSIMNSIEGLSGIPRHKPPFPAQSGLWGKPTAINNVETLANVALLFDDDKWDDGYRLFSVSGDVNNGGVFEEKKGVLFRDLIGKTKPKGKVKAVFFGAAGGCVPYDEMAHFDFDEIRKKGAGLGSCTIIVACEKRSIVEICYNISRFFIHENCGKCTPCRDGNYRIVQLLERIIKGKGTKKDIILLEELCGFVKDSSFCPLGQSSCNHIICSLKYFRNEFDKLCR